jgi:DNA-binding transcriptional MerR regulator
MPDELRYTTSEAARMAGIRLRQLQLWDENGIVVPDRIGYRRQYTAQQVTELRLIHRLRSEGISLRRAAAILVEARRNGFFNAIVFRQGEQTHFIPITYDQALSLITRDAAVPGEQVA